MERNLLVLGASSAVGVAAIKRMAGQFGTVFVHYHRSGEELEELQREFPNLQMFSADFTNPKSTQNFVHEVEETGRAVTHILHCPSARLKTVRFSSLTWENYEEMLQTQLRSFVTVLQAFLPKMAKRREGRVAAILTSATVGTPPAFMNDYLAAKYALLGCLRGLAAEYASKNVQINAVSPSMMETKFVNSLPHLIVEKNAAENPMGRNASVEDIVPLLEYLLLGESGFVTGQNILVSGGSLI